MHSTRRSKPRSLRKWASIALAGALAFPAASTAHAKQPVIKHSELVVHTLNPDGTAPKDFFKNVVNARMKIQIQNAKTVSQKVRVLEENLSDRDKAYLNLLIEREIEANPVMAELNRRLAEQKSRNRTLQLALWSAGFATPSLLLGAFVLGHRRGRRTKPASYGWSGLH